MLTDKIQKILKENLGEHETLNKLEELYYKYENNQVRLSIEEQKRELKALLEPYVQKYGPDMLNDFYRWWTAHNPKGKKCRYKMEKVFHLPGRLSTWYQNNLSREEKDRLVSKYAFLAK